MIGMSRNNQKKRTLANFFERIGERTAGDSAAEADARPQGLLHGTIKPVGNATYTHVLRVRGLHLILPEWLHLDDMLRGKGCGLVITRDLVGD